MNNKKGTSIKNQSKSDKSSYRREWPSRSTTHVAFNRKWWFVILLALLILRGKKVLLTNCAKIAAFLMRIMGLLKDYLWDSSNCFCNHEKPIEDVGIKNLLLSSLRTVWSVNLCLKALMCPFLHAYRVVILLTFMLSNET